MSNDEIIRELCVLLDCKQSEVFDRVFNMKTTIEDLREAFNNYHG